MSEQASLVQQFINYLRAERHFSPHTAKCYAADLQQFCGYLCTLERYGPPPGDSGNGHTATAADMAKLAPPPGVAGEELNRRLLLVETDDVRALMSQLRDHN
nr:site-specific integrase [Phycisphaerae bacterium]